MEELFGSIFGLTFKSTNIVDRLHNNTNAIQLKNEDNKIIFVLKELEYLYVNNIQKYGDYTGNEIIQNIIQIGKLLNFRYIELNDCAMFNLGEYNNFSIALAPFEIITSGMSWYNKLGFKNDNTDDEILKNKQISNSHFDNLISTKLLSKFNEHFIDTHEKTLKHIFMHLKYNYINRNKNRIKMTYEQSDILEELTLELCDILIYETTLRYDIVTY